jgi:hypothetical protein
MARSLRLNPVSESHLQAIFLERLARPCWDALAPIAPRSVAIVLEHYAENLSAWQDLERQGVVQLPG